MSTEQHLIEPRLTESGGHTLPSNTRRDDIVSDVTNEYLNIFNDLAMTLEQLPQTPELREDLLHWRSVTYREHLESAETQSGASAWEAFERLNPGFRQRLERLVEELDLIAVASVATTRRMFKNGDPTDSERASATCERAAHKMRDVLDRTSRLVNFTQLRAA